MKKTITNNIHDFKNFVFSFMEPLEREKDATIVALSGDLGSGKTTFVKHVADFFGVEEDITSPTFVIQKEYFLGKDFLFKKMIHIDAYRLGDKKELEFLGWNELISDSRNIIFIEWPEQVKGIEMPEVINVLIENLEGESRKITVT